MYGFTPYAEFAKTFVTEQFIEDPSFAIRVLRESVLQARALTESKVMDKFSINEFHREPPTTGINGWDALLAGVAVFSGAGYVDTGVLAWCADESRWCQELFDPLNISDEYVMLEMLRTPAAIRERNVILAAGNLEGV